MVERGTVLIVSSGGGIAGKPRPAIVVQSSQFDFPETLVIVPLTSSSAENNVAMPKIFADSENGLDGESTAMIHRIGAVRKSDIGKIIGRLSDNDMERVDNALSLLLTLGQR